METGATPLRGRRDPHEVLGVPRDADRQQVVVAFRRKARQGGHPDTGGDARGFDEIVRARDELLAAPAPAQQAVVGARTAAAATAPPTRVRRGAAPWEISPLAFIAVGLALLGPLLWPVALVVGLLALRQFAPAGKGGFRFAPLALTFLYLLTPAVLTGVLLLLLG